MLMFIAGSQEQLQVNVYASTIGKVFNVYTKF